MSNSKWLFQREVGNCVSASNISVVLIFRAYMHACLIVDQPERRNM